MIVILCEAGWIGAPRLGAIKQVTLAPVGFERYAKTTRRATINPAHLQTNLDILQQGPLPPDLYEEAKRRIAAASWRDRMPSH